MKVFDYGQLRFARRRQHLKQEDAAHALHVTPATVSNMENGKVKTSAEDLAVLSDLYRTDINEFFPERIM